MFDKDRKLFVGFFGILLISMLLYPYPSNLPQKEISVSLYYLYHFEDDISPNWYEDTTEASKIAQERLNSLNLFNGYYFTFHTGGTYRIESVEFGHGTASPEFDQTDTMNHIIQELIDPQTNFLEERNDSNITILVFPLSKCVSRQYTIVSGKGSTPIFLSYNAILAEIHFERFIIEHEILHTFGLPDRDCDEGKNCDYPDDEISVMEKNPQDFYLSRGDYLRFRFDRVNPIDLSIVANRDGSDRLPRPYINEDGSCPIPVKSTREWRLIYGE